MPWLCRKYCGAPLPFITGALELAVLGARHGKLALSLGLPTYLRPEAALEGPILSPMPILAQAQLSQLCVCLLKSGCAGKILSYNLSVAEQRRPDDP